ncbi:hypothetical protein GCM10023196_031820 [Actinoallomurus vinaceus]|uniref:Uncharacterized protein n=1 Tax=Actinoallomurus vinaceus TaxID=1080074 RepID=A0ABP8UBF2_9ACTN
MTRTHPRDGDPPTRRRPAYTTETGHVTQAGPRDADPPAWRRRTHVTETRSRDGGVTKAAYVSDYVTETGPRDSDPLT